MVSNFQPMVPLSSIPNHCEFQFVSEEGILHPADFTFTKLGVTGEGLCIICQAGLPQTEPYLQYLDGSCLVIKVNHN